ncbi:MAG TPA: ribosomal protein S18-alanine N-acetyltransferase [Longimicrobiales bacterium]|nr:ribosomal protein S18-alanine N-acetyltransferase [Longimicrobiales bacterium]
MSTLEPRTHAGGGGAGVPGVTLRPMRTRDLARVLEIERAVFTMAWSVATFRSLLGRSDAEAWVAERAGRIAGYAVFWVVLDEAELGDIAVDEELRGAGIGAMLLEHVARRVAARGVRKLFLEVRVSNEGARRLYERHGFETTAVRRGYYLEPVEDALVMARELEPGRPDRPDEAD